MTEFFSVPASAGPELDEILQIYTDSFSPDGRHPLGVVRERLAQGRYTLVGGREGAEIVFFALLWPLRGTEFVLLDYLATKAGHRGRGIGSAFLRDVRSMPEMAGKSLLLEVEDPRCGEDRAKRERRVPFYRRNGAREIEGVAYFMPGLASGPPMKMILMLLPAAARATETSDAAEIDQAAVRRLIVQIYAELYNRAADDPLLNSFLDAARSPEIPRRDPQ